MVFSSHPSLFLSPSFPTFLPFLTPFLPHFSNHFRVYDMPGTVPCIECTENYKIITQSLCVQILWHSYLKGKLRLVVVCWVWTGHRKSSKWMIATANTKEIKMNNLQSVYNRGESCSQEKTLYFKTRRAKSSYEIGGLIKICS